MFQTKISIEAAVELLLQHVAPNENPDEIPLLQALGRVAFADCCAVMNQPPFDCSPLDGYALRHEDTETAAEQTPVSLHITQAIYAGGAPNRPLTAGEAAIVTTGAALPPGATCVIREEDTTVCGQTVQIPFSLKKYENYVFQGEDVKKGQPLLLHGDVLSPGSLGTLAGQGMTHVKTFARPRLGILSTGSEVVSPGDPLPTGKRYNSNDYLLTARGSEVGAETTGSRGSSISDDPAAIACAVQKLLATSDIVVTTGGVSAGTRDYVPEASSLLEAQLLFRQVAAKPGTPVTAWIKDGKLIVGLSGNPFGAYAMFEVLVVPVLRKMLGMRDPLHKRTIGLLCNTFEKASPIRRLLRAYWDGKAVTLPAGNHASGALHALSNCNCLVDIPASTPRLKRGDFVEVILF